MIWKKIPNWEEYEVSDYGSVRSYKNGKYGLRAEPRELTPLEDGRGKYLSVILCRNGERKKYKVHQLVAMAFLGHKPSGSNKGLVVDHIDNNPRNNHVKNLQLLTDSENRHKNPSGISGVVGVVWDKRSRKWKAEHRVNGQPKWLGLHKTIKGASVAIEEYKATLTKQVARF